MGYSFAFQYSPVTCKDDPFFFNGEVNDMPVLKIILIEAVETQETQPSGQLSKMYIEDEPGIP